MNYTKNVVKKKIAGTVLFVSWLAKYQWKKIIEQCNSVGAGVHKVGKVVSLWSRFDPSFLDILECEKGKLHMLKKVGLSTSKEIL